MTTEDAAGTPAVVRAAGRPGDGRLPLVGTPPHPGRPWPGVGVWWLPDATALAVTTWGSSSHPRSPRTARVEGGELVLTIEHRQATGPMTADLAPHTTVIEPPAGLDPTTPTRVRIGELVLDLPPAGGPPPEPRPPRVEPDDGLPPHPRGIGGGRRGPERPGRWSGGKR
ncbi:hypothetical protein [Modestobacter italicus]|uniref:hypothetical protein n=1 Tax=Modestobacter italicus (strain DSM 44449 / CECT 9708 / BC 501) TaxID=2732864 RepID=UPI001C9715F0|nr:hypothetical protein [Modestobacter italicus]